MRDEQGRFVSVFEGSFMQPEIHAGQFFEVETTHGTEIVPCFVLPYFPRDRKSTLQEYCNGTVLSWRLESGYVARLSAPGYLDCTDWAGFTKRKAAEAYLRELAGDE